MDKLLACLFGLLMVLLWQPEVVRSQPPNLRFDHLSIENGLPSSTVYTIAKDRQGFMWFGTRRCPIRYDGVSFRAYLSPETNTVWGLAVDSTNQVWIAADGGGLFRLKQGQRQLEPVASFRSQVGAFFVASATEGWFGSFRGIERIDLKTGTIRHYPLPQTSYYGLKVKGFLQDRQQTIWAISSDNGLLRLDRRHDRFVPVPIRIDSTRHRPLYFSSGCVGTDGGFWLGTYGQGLLRFNPETGAYRFFKTTEQPDNVTCVAEGHDETGRRVLWVGRTDGLLAFRPDQERFYRIPNLLPNAAEPLWVYAVFQDTAADRLWIGTSNGIFKYNALDNVVRSVRWPPGLTQQAATVNVMLADQTDPTGETFFIGLSNTGFLRWHRPTNQFRLIRYPALSAETKWMQQTPDGRLWIGLRRWDYRGDGLLVYDPATSRFVHERAARQASKLFSVPFIDNGFIDKQQRLWVGNTDEGLRVVRLRTGQPIRYWPDSVILALQRGNNFLTGLAQDSTGRIWLSTYQGLVLADSVAGRFIRAEFPTPARLHSVVLSANQVLTSRNGHLWAARWGSITESLPTGQIQTVLTPKQGLYDPENRQVAEDRYGTIWIGNAEGLYAYNPATHRLIRLTTSDGLSRNNTTGALFCHRGNMLFVGQVNGFDYIDSQRLNQPKPAPIVTISAVHIKEQERPTNGQFIRLTSSERSFGVDFSTLTYDRLPTASYAYFLEGFDKDWHYIGTSPHATYTNLNPGQYTLYLKAADSFGQWSQRPTILRLDVVPAFYETWWFRVLLALPVLALLYGLYHYRVQQLLRVQQLRTQISADLHDEIGSSLSGIGILGNMARQHLTEEHPADSLLERITMEAHNLGSSLDDIVWSINPNNDELSVLLARMQRQAAEVLEAAALNYRIEMPEQIPPLNLPMEKRRDFYLIFREVINNVVKHAHCQHVTIRIHLEQGRLWLCVSDDGVGFDPEQPTERNGIRNLYKRAQNLRGNLLIDSRLQKGTSLQFDFPVSG